MLRRASLGLAGIALPVLEMQQLVLEQCREILDLLETAPIGGVELLPRNDAELNVGITKIPTPDLHLVAHPPFQRHAVINHLGGGHVLAGRNRLREIQHFLVSGMALA